MALTPNPLGLGTQIQAQTLLQICSVALIAPSVSLPSQQEQTVLFGLQPNSDKAQIIMDQLISKI